MLPTLTRLPEKTVLKTLEFDCAYDLYAQEGVCANVESCACVRSQALFHAAQFVFVPLTPDDVVVDTG